MTSMKRIDCLISNYISSQLRSRSVDLVMKKAADGGHGMGNRWVKLETPMDSLEWKDDLILDFSVEESRRRRSVVTGESDEVRARVKVRRRSTDEDDRGEDEDENVEIIGECPGGNRQSLGRTVEPACKVSVLPNEN